MLILLYFIIYPRLTKGGNHWYKENCPFHWDFRFIESIFSEEHSLGVEPIVRCIHHAHFR